MMGQARVGPESLGFDECSGKRFSAEIVWKSIHNQNLV